MTEVSGPAEKVDASKDRGKIHHFLFGFLTIYNLQCHNISKILGAKISRVFCKSRKQNEETVMKRDLRYCFSSFAFLDIALARVEWEKKLALIKAWEESEKIKAENK